MLARLVSTTIAVQNWWNSLKRSARKNTAVTNMQERARRWMDAAGTACNGAVGRVRKGLASLGPRNQNQHGCDNIVMTENLAEPPFIRPDSFPPNQPLRRNLIDWNYLTKCGSDGQPGLKGKTPPSREPERGGTSQGRSEENGRVTNGGGSLTIPRTPFSAQELECYLMFAIHSKELTEQLETVPLEDKTKNKSVASEACNKKKNRYRNNIPYDETRVVLHDHPDHDYINASYISCPSGKRYYIAAQGPKGANERTVDDFWLMVWQNKTNMIIMVANLVENGRDKVAQYWPSTVGGTEEYGNVKVMLRFEEKRLDYTFRHLIVSVDACSRHVVQYQYTAWPDHGVPSSPVGAARMIYNICTWEWSGPPVIHCSAGLGRTGTILLVLALLNTLKAEGHFDPPHALRMLRMCRPNLLDNQLQFRLVHHVLLELLFGYKTRLFRHKLYSNEFLASHNDRLHQEFLKLKSFNPRLTFDWARIYDSTFNRDPSVLPADGRQALLMESNNQQYVNAVLVRGPNLKDAWIVTEHPMSHTMDRAWKLAFTRYASAWVFLHDHTNLPDQEDFPSVLPSSGQEEQEGLTIKVESHVEHRFFNETTVTVSQITSHTMQVIQFKDWHPSREVPGHTQSLLALVERLWKLRGTASYSPIIISCSDGYSASGVLVTLARLMEEVKLTQSVDVFHTVLSVRYDRPQFIKSEMQYKFLYSALKEKGNEQQHIQSQDGLKNKPKLKEPVVETGKQNREETKQQETRQRPTESEPRKEKDGMKTDVGDKHEGNRQCGRQPNNTKEEGVTSPAEDPHYERVWLEDAQEKDKTYENIWEVQETQGTDGDVNEIV